MSDEAPNVGGPAWQPFTFAGVAAFAGARLARVGVAQLLTAALVGASLAWCLARSFAPVVDAAVARMPDGAVLRNGALSGVSSQLLAENKFLSIAIDLDDLGSLGEDADLQISLHRDGLQVACVLKSAFGALLFDYPQDSQLAMGRLVVEPWWGAWHPLILLGAALSTGAALLIVWAVLAVLYTLPAKLAAFLADRALSWSGAWKLSAAALLPGAVFLGVAIQLYSFRALDLFGLGWFWVVHWGIGWVYVIASPCCGPRISRQLPSANPFTPHPSDHEKPPS